MALADILTSGVATAKAILNTGKLLTTIYHYRFLGLNEYGEPTFSPRIARTGLVQASTERVITGPGVETQATVKITFLEDVLVNPNDRFDNPYLTTGMTLPAMNVLRADRNVVGASKQAFVTEVYL